MADVQSPVEHPRPAGPRADVAAFELLTQALVGITTQSLDALDGAVTVSQFRCCARWTDWAGSRPPRWRRRCATAASSVTRLVDKLEAAGFVTRGSDAHSRSIVTVEVDRGRARGGGATCSPAGTPCCRPCSTPWTRPSASTPRSPPAASPSSPATRSPPARTARGAVSPQPGTAQPSARARREPASDAVRPPPPREHGPRSTRLGDFTLDARVLPITGLALLVGAAGAGAAYCLLRLIGLITNLVFYQRVSTALVAPGAVHHDPALVLLAPVAGGLIVGLMARFGSEKIRGHGMPEAIEAILTGGSRVQPRVAVLKPISAAISIGTGGPFGAEGPIIMTGGAVGSILAQALKLTADERKTLLVAGAAAGMAATFNAPLASVLLAVELLLFEWRPRSLVPVGAAVTVAVVCRGWLLGTAPVFPVTDLVHPGPAAIGLSLIPGLTGGLLAIAATGLVYLAEDAFKKLPFHWMWWPAIGGAIIGVGGLIEPRALGVGYDVIDQLLTGRAALSLILGILIVKTLIWSLSLGSGTSGGVLAPVFMIGGALGRPRGEPAAARLPRLLGDGRAGGGGRRGDALPADRHRLHPRAHPRLERPDPAAGRLGQRLPALGPAAQALGADREDRPPRPAPDPRVLHRPARDLLRPRGDDARPGRAGRRRDARRRAPRPAGGPSPPTSRRRPATRHAPPPRSTRSSTRAAPSPGCVTHRELLAAAGRGRPAAPSATWPARRRR